MSWISPKGEKRSLSTDSGVYLLITRKMRLLGGSSRLSTPGRKPPAPAQLPASSMVLHPRAGGRPRTLSVLASAVPANRPVAHQPLQVRCSASGRRRSPGRGAVSPLCELISGTRPAAPPGGPGEPLRFRRPTLGNGAPDVRLEWSGLVHRFSRSWLYSAHRAQEFDL